MADIITRSGKGAALTHAEMDQNLTNLNDEIASNQADALVKLQGRSEAQFMALAAAKRDRYTGSGFIEWGKSYNNASYPIIAEGMWSYPTLANTLVLGNSSTAIGVSKSFYPIVNINGFTLHISQVNRTTLDAQVRVIFPPAPAISTMLERQDIVFLEAWHEKIADKDIVYPLGNTQWTPASDPSTSLTTVAGSFTGYGTYSLYGNWQSSGDLIGLGLVWSTLSEANKKKFVSDPRNNVYLAEDGTLVQIRYRIRVVEGLGAEWGNVKDTTDDLIYDSSTGFVKPKGMLVSIDNDLTAHTSDYSGYFAGTEWATTNGQVSNIGMFSALAGDFTIPTTFSYKGLCFAIPIALVSRRNQGAFHNVFNPNGTRKFLRATGTDGVLNGGRLFYDYTTQATETSAGGMIPASIEDCFKIGDLGSSVTDDVYARSDTGYIGGADPGSIDGKFYDAIYEGDVDDLRSSAHKQELSRTLDREFDKLGASEVRGYDSQRGGFSQIHSGRVWYAAFIYWFSSLYISEDERPDPFERFLLLCNGVFGTGVVQGDNTKFKAYRMDGTGINNTADWDAYFGSTPTTPVYMVGSVKSNIKYKELLHCDIIGDPANYPSEWLTNGMFGTPLIVGESREDYVDETTYTNITQIKLSRKVKSPLIYLYSDDSGSTWSGGASFTVDSSSNKPTLVGTTTSTRLWLLFYLTEASPLETADNAEVLFKSNEVFGSSSLLSSHLISNLIGKVPVVNLGSAGFSTLISSALSIPSLELSDSTSIGRQPEHNDVTKYLTAAEVPAVKVLWYLTRENGKLYLQLLFKEMVYDSSFDSSTDFTSVTSDNASWVAGTYYRVTNGNFVGSWLCVASVSQSLDLNNWYRTGDDLMYASTVYFKAFDGNGWGDDNKFNVVDGISTTTDDNGNTVLIGQKRIELPYFVEDAA